jgi:hypothetical protein
MDVDSDFIPNKDIPGSPSFDDPVSIISRVFSIAPEE